MMKYLLNDKRNNSVDDLLDYHEMFYVNKKIEYHPGAYDFYKEIHFISNEEDIEDNIYTKIDKKNIFSKFNTLETNPSILALLSFSVTFSFCLSTVTTSGELACEF